MRFLISLFCLIALATGAAAAPRSYDLDHAQSKVIFTWFLGQDAVQGLMPVKTADLRLDFDRAANSVIDVSLDAAAARAGFAFATGAMKGPQVLDAKAHPEIRFRSTKVVGRGAGAQVLGDLTIRGVTRPTTFDVALFKGGGDPAEGRLAVQITGSVNRSEFGATGWPDMVSDRIDFNILAYVTPVG